jgi:hypothetical protein
LVVACDGRTAECIAEASKEARSIVIGDGGLKPGRSPAVRWTAIRAPRVVRIEGGFAEWLRAVPADPTDPCWQADGLSYKESATEPGVWRIAEVKRLPMRPTVLVEIVHRYAPNVALEGANERSND